jgi:hypothetical protein
LRTAIVSPSTDTKISRTPASVGARRLTVITATPLKRVSI